MNNLFLRHGEVNNPKNIHYSNLPGFSLSTNGNFQARSIGEKIKKNFEIEKIITSPLLRARQTAQLVNEFLNVKIEISNDIIEWQGPEGWTGKIFNEITNTEAYSKYKSNPLTIDTVNEPLEKVYERVKKLVSENQHSLMVSHQDTIRAYFYFELKEARFNLNKPNHCDVQYLNNGELKVLSLT